MIISNSTIGMESARKYSCVSMEARSSSLITFEPSKNQIKVLADNKESDDKTTAFNGFKDSMDNLMKRYEEMRTNRIMPNRQEMEAMNRIKTECINYLIRLLFGGSVDDSYMKSKLDDECTTNSTTNSESQQNTGTNNFVLGLSTTKQSYFKEEEDVTYSTSGTVVTADGREINFGLDFQMSRSFEEYAEEHLELNFSMCDPLVINLDSNIASVSDQKFMFDIDCDGIKDSISILNGGSGYLALDQNSDGIINDGSELFGTKSGDGFKDLSMYDSDGNGWIDEADEIWDKLLIYSMNEDGSSSLYGLSEKGIGAIYLGNVSTDFSLNNQDTNEVNAAIRKTGIFLYENGNVGTIQHVDMAKHLDIAN